MIHHYNSLSQGGAFNGVLRLHEGLLRLGKKSRLFYFKNQYKGAISDVTSYECYVSQRKSVPRGSKDTHGLRPKSFCEKFSYPCIEDTQTPILFDDDYKTYPDIINLHWISDNIDLPSLMKSIPDEKAFIWTLHDMSPFTGGCHYAGSCYKYTEHCSKCVQLEESPLFDASERSFAIKKQLLRSKEFHVVANSEWLCNEAQKSPIFHRAKSFRTIHYGLNTEEYIPIEKKRAREELGIDDQCFALCFGAERLANRRKGFAQLIEAIKLVKRDCQNLYLITFGKEHTLFDCECKHAHFGQIDSAKRQALVYSAADVFVIPSLQEAFGQTSLEAMACGTPVVGFDTGGIPDMVHPGKTGLLAPTGNVVELARCISILVKKVQLRRQMSRNCRAFVEKHCTLEKQSNAYIRLYESVLRG